MELSQTDADDLISMEKQGVQEEQYQYPGTGGSLIVPLRSVEGHEYFLLDISRGQINLLKGKYQNRARQTVILLRLDYGGGAHRNPDGEEIPCPHLHSYKEGYGDKWASELPADYFSDINDPWQTLNDFLHYCNVTRLPDIERGLFV